MGGFLSGLEYHGQKCCLCRQRRRLFLGAQATVPFLNPGTILRVHVESAAVFFDLGLAMFGMREITAPLPAAIRHFSADRAARVTVVAPPGERHTTNDALRRAGFAELSILFPASGQAARTRAGQGMEMTRKR
jgi:hypothetical protein